jgi:hypothetical protein
VGWALVPTRYRSAFVAAKRSADLGNAVLAQLVLAQLMESGELERQLRFLRKRHRRRRDVMIAAIGTHLPGAVVHGAAAGLHLMITFDADFADVDLAAAALEQGVKTQPLSWHTQLRRPPGLVDLAAGRAIPLPDEIADVPLDLRDGPPAHLGGVRGDDRADKGAGQLAGDDVAREVGDRRTDLDLADIEPGDVAGVRAEGEGAGGTAAPRRRGRHEGGPHEGLLGARGGAARGARFSGASR